MIAMILFLGFRTGIVVASLIPSAIAVSLFVMSILDIGLDYAMANQQWVFSLYGRNLLDSVNHGGDTQLPPVIGPVPTGGTFSPLVKGAIVGLEVTFRN